MPRRRNNGGAKGNNGRGANGRLPGRKGGGKGRGAFGSYEITQGLVTMSPLYGSVCRICRSIVYDLTFGSVSGSGYFFDWSLSDVTNVGEFQALFAQWRISRCAITISWRSANEANPIRPQLFFAVDPFATAAPTSATEVLERPNRSWSPNAQRTVLQLNVNAQALNLAASSAGSGALVINTLAPRGAYYPTSSPQISYGSLLLWISGWSVSSSGTFTIKQDYEFHLRSSK